MVRTRLGNVLLLLNRGFEAEAILRSAIALDKTDGTSHYLLGRALLGQSRWAEAVESQAIRLNPADGNSRALLLRTRRRGCSLGAWFRLSPEYRGLP